MNISYNYIIEGASSIMHEPHMCHTTWG